MIKLQPSSLPTPVVSNHDRITAALNQALRDQEKDQELNQCARGVAVIWLREYPNGAYGSSWIVQGINEIEMLGLLQLVTHDINAVGIADAPDHFSPEDTPA